MSEFSVWVIMQNRKLGVEKPRKILSEVSKISENSEFFTSPALSYFSSHTFHQILHEMMNIHAIDHAQVN